VAKIKTQHIAVNGMNDDGKYHHFSGIPLYSILDENGRRFLGSKDIIRQKFPNWEIEFVKAE